MRPISDGSLAASPRRDVQDGAATLTWTWEGPGATEFVQRPVSREEVPGSGRTIRRRSGTRIRPAPCVAKLPGTRRVAGLRAMQDGQARQSGPDLQRVSSHLSNGSLKIAHSQPADCVVTANEQATFGIHANRRVPRDTFRTASGNYRALQFPSRLWEVYPRCNGTGRDSDAGTISLRALRCHAKKRLQQHQQPG